MKHLALCLALAPFASDAALETEAHYVDCSIDLDGELLSWRFVDIDRDGADELLLAVRAPSGARELRVHAVSRERVEPVARQVISVLGDVIAYGVADVRAEPGAELLFLTRVGVWSYSPTLPGYRDNAVALFRSELLYELPDPRALPFWAYVIPSAERDLVLVPERDRLALYGPSANGEYELRATFAREIQFPGRRDAFATAGEGPMVKVGIDDEENALLIDADGAPELLSHSASSLAPALVDLDGDGWLDLCFDRAKELAVHLGGPAGPASAPTRVEPLPAELGTTDKSKASLRLVDLDGDRYLDLLALVEDDARGFKNGLKRLFLYRGSAQGLVLAEPDQILRFEAAVLRIDVADVDGDGRRDLALRKLEVPSVVETMTGLEFHYSYLVYLGEKRSFARRPVLEQTETYNEESVARLAANRELVLDHDGDGIADLVEIDLAGRIAIRRLRRESSFLRGDAWKVESGPWKLFEDAGEILSLSVADRNGDGLGDVVSAGARSLTVLWSVRGGGR